MDDYRMNEEQSENDVYESYDSAYRQPKKKKRVGLRVFAIIMAVVLALGGIGYGSYRVVRKVYAASAEERTQTETVLKTEDRELTALPDADDSKGEIAVTSAAQENTASSSSQLALSKNGSIDEAETDAKTVVLDVSEVVENVMPCVVAITDNLEYTGSNAYNPYNYYFGGSFGGSEKKESVASGSGVIIAEDDENLLIVTNNHVVSNEGTYSYYTVSSTGLTVQFVDGSTADASVKGTDSDADLAVITVKLSDISDETMQAIRIAAIGNSDDVKVGSGVIAIGNAMGYGQSVTTGIISAKDREVTINGITRNLMQTDAAINPGNSGGGLFNSKGELIGINSAKSVDTSVEGMGFAIPITSAEDIIEGLMNHVEIAEEDQGYLGINGETVPSTYIEQYGYPKGVSVTRIAEGSPAEEAGLQIYDIITEVNGRKVETMASLKNQVNSYEAGTTITLSVSRPEGRGFKEIEVEAKLVRYSDIQGSAGAPATQAPEEESKESGDGQQGDDWQHEGDGDIDSFFDWLFERLN